MSKTKIHFPQWKKQAGARPCAETERDSLAGQIALTAEVCGHPLSRAAVEMLADDLNIFDEAAICAALARCRLELNGPLRAGEILARLDDGRPGADEAWSMMPAGEHDSVVWSDEMAQAWGAAQPLLGAGDAPAAQAAFRAAYERLVLEARLRREPPRWTPSLGHDAAGRELALRDAVRKGRASVAQVEALLGRRLDVRGDAGEFLQANIKSLH